MPETPRPDLPEHASLSWLEGAIPVATRFDDPYFSLKGGLEETRHVFLAGNDLPARLQDGFHVAELGFGTGLNLLTLALAWQEAGQGAARGAGQGAGQGQLRYTSFEAFPMQPDDMERALRHFPQAHAIAAPLLDAMRAGLQEFQLPGIDVTLIAGDVRDTLPAWRGRADAWFLDGFSPAKNPEMWGEALMGEVAHHTARGGSFATYTAAGHVRRALAGAGFVVRRLPGFAGKRHMSAGFLS
ncbi:tRNA (5-methylaminomethyl-2-thiouridine)(34)-methyltransferase MnmD [Xinfangfangia sp. D13-10-4-6]|uniref:tRNA (5-methylaminomethyl-2-thiouridine)(34)-methyltransferase MnmD n=1 Tax=Pseudogemmobacter hezensis TaxID=2737662 RepID=UPI001555B1B7|nr:tRNA (5-methylaminomethyl-2-thiouridine)(34)-methyltransferase MnmD [Pseudogemmobacter hezensis]NPD15560.1 tRNA (5-methylaminomethyl-2-thiouridine)(34)-methyltransferase MnmD [Pseudogemmobacter hezensis]